MAKETHTTGKANALLRNLEDSTGVSKARLATIAAACSVRKNGAMDFSDRVYDKAGGFRIHLPNVDPRGILSMYLSALYSVAPDSEECVELVCNHVNEGCSILEDLLAHAVDPDSFLVELESQFSSFAPGLARDSGYHQGLNIIAGHVDGSQDHPFVWPLNQARSNPHTAILGATRSGKTQLLLDILFQISDSSRGCSNFVFLAYRKDGHLNEFADGEGVEALDPDEAPLPINPFILNDYSDREVAKSAQDKCDMICEFDRNLGSRQKGFFRDGIITAYQARKGRPVPYPDFEEVRAEVLRQYGNQRDSLTELLDSFVSLSLFQRSEGGGAVRRFLSDRNLIIKLQGIPDKHRAIVASFVLESFVRECSTVPAAEIDPETDTRSLRTCIVIDEAHNYLQGKNIFLEKLLRESAQAGFVVFLATQTPSSLCDKKDLLDLLGNFFVFRCPVKPNEALVLTGCRDNVKRQIAEEIRNLSPGHCFVNHTPNPNVPYCKIEAVQYYKRGLSS